MGIRVSTLRQVKTKEMNSKIMYYKSGMTFRIKGDWSELSKLLQETYPRLTNEDLQFVFGKEHELLNRIESRLMLSREEVMQILQKAIPRKAVQIRFKTRRNLTNRN